MDTPGQRLLASLVDVCFFALVGVLAVRHVLTEQAILPILLLYARERFAVAQSKQITAMIGGTGGSSGRPPPGDDGPPSGGTGTSGRMGQIQPTPQRDPSTYVKRLAILLKRYTQHPVVVAAIVLACLLR